MVTMHDWVTLLDDDTQRFAAVLHHGDLGAAVPPCPGWTLADLADHVCGIYQWAAHAISAGNPDARIEPAPRDRTGLEQWYRTQADALIGLLSTTPADAPAWGFGPKPRTASFWARRQVHETDMHLWDAMASQGQEHAFSPARALDGVDEVLSVFFPRQVRLGRMAPLASAVALAPDDEPLSQRSWVLSGDGMATAQSEPAATVHGPAEAVLLMLWKRIGLDDTRLRVTGDRDVAAAVLSASLTP